MCNVIDDRITLQCKPGMSHSSWPLVDIEFHMPAEHELRTICKAEKKFILDFGSFHIC